MTEPWYLGWVRRTDAARWAVLPTVWSNLLAALWLAQGTAGGPWTDFWRLLDGLRAGLVLAGASLAMLAAAPDRGEGGNAQRAPTWWLLVGALLIALAGRTPAVLAVTLMATVIGTRLLPADAWLAPVLQGLTRFVLYLTAAATLPHGWTGWVIWGGVVMAAFVAGIGFIVRQQTLGQRPLLWPGLLLAAPLVLAWVMNNGPYREAAFLVAVVLVLWVVRSGYPLFRSLPVAPPPVGMVLWPSIVLVDWLALADAPRTSTLVMVPLFLLALLLQRSSSPAAARG